MTKGRLLSAQVKSCFEMSKNCQFLMDNIKICYTIWQIQACQLILLKSSMHHLSFSATQCSDFTDFTISRIAWQNSFYFNETNSLFKSVVKSEVVIREIVHSVKSYLHLWPRVNIVNCSTFTTPSKLDNHP